LEVGWTILVIVFGLAALICVVVMPSVAYARFIVTGLLRETLSADAIRFATLFLISLDAMALHSLYRFGFAETQWRYPLLSPVILCLLLLLGSLSVANGAILIASTRSEARGASPSAIPYNEVCSDA
jgi:hypothetical protein